MVLFKHWFKDPTSQILWKASFFDFAKRRWRTWPTSRQGVGRNGVRTHCTYVGESIEIENKNLLSLSEEKTTSLLVSVCLCMCSWLCRCIFVYECLYVSFCSSVCVGVWFSVYLVLYLCLVFFVSACLCVYVCVCLINVCEGNCNTEKQYLNSHLDNGFSEWRRTKMLKHFSSRFLDIVWMKYHSILHFLNPQTLLYRMVLKWNELNKNSTL